MSAERSKPFSDNVEKVVRLAKESLDRRSATTKIGTRITNGLGTMASAIIHLAVIGAWCLINSDLVSFIKSFDPYPFNLLTLIVSFESVLIAIFVLLTQNRMSKEADLRAHVNLQMCLLMEQELTAVLHVVSGIGKRYGIDAEEHPVSQLLEPTDVGVLASELEEKLPADS